MEARLSGRAWDVVIVGAGINGCVSARALAPDLDVLVLDRGPVAGETTGQASGLVSIACDYEQHLGAARFAIDFFDAYDGTGNFDYTRRANVELVTEETFDDRRAAADRFLEHGFDVEFVTVDELEARFPDTFNTASFEGALIYNEEGWVDPYTLTMTYQADAEADGATVETGVTVEAIATDGDVVVGVETDAGPVEASTVVVAAGWHTKGLVEPFVELPIRPFRYQTVNLETSRSFEDWYPTAWEPTTRLYWRPEHNGDLHVGGGTYFAGEPPEVRTTVTDAFRRLVASAIGRYLEGVDDARIASDGTCPEGDAATPDSLAIYDAPASPSGLVIATGMEGFGIMASPVTGAAVRSLVTGEPAPFDLAPFALDRFGPDASGFGSDYIVESPAALLERL